MKHLKLFESFSKDKYYHCSNSKFDEFDSSDNKTYKEFDIPSWFFTKDIEYAKTYGKYLYEVELNIGKCFDTLKPSHMKMLKDYMESEGQSKEQMDNVLDEQFFQGRPYWTCADAFYAAVSNGFNSILIQEELEKEVLSIAVFDTSQIKITNVIELK